MASIRWNPANIEVSTTIQDIFVSDYAALVELSDALAKKSLIIAGYEQTKEKEDHRWWQYCPE